MISQMKADFFHNGWRFPVVFKHALGSRRARVIQAANDVEAIAQAEAMRGSLAAELLDVDGLRIVKYLPGNGGSPPQAAE